MHRIDIGIDAAAALVASIAEHLPPYASMGRLVVATARTVLADDCGVPATFGIDDDGAWRVAELRDGRLELTTWNAGAEQGRRILRDGPPID
jgi:hypothetical protein